MTTSTDSSVMRWDGRSSAPFVKRRSRRRREPLLGLLLLAFQSRLVNSNQRTTSIMDDSPGGAWFTDNGYDHPNSQNPLCWQEITTRNASLFYNTQSSSSFASPFDDSSTTVRLLPSCPNQTTISAALSMSNDNDNRQLITLPDGTWMGHTNIEYLYNVQGTVDLSQWNATPTDQLQIGVSMTLCSVEEVRFCSPFVQNLTSAPNVPLGTLNDGTYITTMVHQVPLLNSFNFSVQVSVQVLEPRAFTIVVGAFFVYPSAFTSSTNVTTYYAVQMANVASDYPVISFWHVQVSRPSQLVAYVLIACSGSFILFLLLVSIRHRQTQVMKLTQGNMLIAMMVTALIATVSAITFEPKNNLYCNLQGPLIILPLHFIFAILLGRLWRIQAVVSPLLLMTLERKDTWSDDFVQWLRKVTELKHSPSKKSRDNYDRQQHQHLHQHNTRVSVVDSVRASWIQTILKRNRSNVSSQQQPPTTKRSFRRKVTEGQLVRVVAIFCFPQFVAQVLYLIFAREQLMNGVCPTDFLASPTDGFGGVLLLLLVLLLLAMARSSKDLPSLFNENEALWDVSLVSLFLLGVSFVVVVITHAPTTNPDIRYIVSTLVVVAITANTCFKIVLPKLRKIWQNEKVVVTKLISDHNRKERSPLVIIPEPPDDEREEEGEDNQRRESRRRNADSIAPPIQSHILPQNVANLQDREPDQDGTDSDESSVALICPSETEPGEPSSLYRFQSEGGESNTRTDSQSMESQHSDHHVVDAVPYRFDPSGPAGILQRLRQGQQSRLSLLSESSSSIPENSLLDSQYPSFAGNVPESEPCPSSHRNVRISRMRHLRAPQASIVRNRSRLNMTHRSRRSGFLSQNSNCELTQGADNGSTRFNVFRQKRRSTRLLGIGCNPKKMNQSIHISLDSLEPPPRRLLLRMIDVNHTLGVVNRNILSGDQVTKESWEFLREAVVALGRVFEEEVVFEWEPHPEELNTLDMPILAATQSAPFAQGFPSINSQQYPRQTILAASQSTPFARDSSYPAYMNSRQTPRQPRTVSLTASVGSSGGGSTSRGRSSSTRPSSNAEGRMPFAPFSRDHSAGRILGGLLQHLPGSRSRLLKRQASNESSLDRQHDLQPPSTSTSPNLATTHVSTTRPRSLPPDSSFSHFGVIHEDVNEQKEEEMEEEKEGLTADVDKQQQQQEEEQEQEEDEEDNKKIQDELLGKFPPPAPPNILPPSGKSDPRSRYRASHGPFSSLTTIMSLSSESMTSEDSAAGFTSSKVLPEQGSSTLFPSTSTTPRDTSKSSTIVNTPITFETEQPQAIDSVLLPSSPAARRTVQMQVNMLSDGNIQADDNVQDIAEIQPSGNGHGMD